MHRDGGFRFALPALHLDSRFRGNDTKGCEGFLPAEVRGVPESSCSSPKNGGPRGLKTIDLRRDLMQAPSLDSRLRGNDRGGCPPEADREQWYPLLRPFSPGRAEGRIPSALLPSPKNGGPRGLIHAAAVEVQQNAAGSLRVSLNSLFLFPHEWGTQGVDS